MSDMPIETRIHDAIAQLRAAGKRVSKSAVFARVGGHKQTIFALCDQLMPPNQDQDQPTPPPVAASDAGTAPGTLGTETGPVAQAADRLALAQAALWESRETMRASLTLVAGYAGQAFVSAGLRIDLDPELQADQAAAVAACEGYRAALQDVRTAEEDLALARQLVHTQQEASTRASHVAALRETDEEFRDIEADIALYSQRVEETSRDAEQANDWRRHRYYLAEAQKRRAAKLARLAAS